MSIADLSSSGATAALEATLRFAGQRQRMIMHNIANASTPNFQQLDVSISDFQANLKQAIEKRREQGPSGAMANGGLDLEETSELKPFADGTFRLKAGTPSGGVMFHDRNNRNIETLMKDNVENGLVFRIAADLLKNRNDLLRTAISQRV